MLETLNWKIEANLTPTRLRNLVYFIPFEQELFLKEVKHQAGIMHKT